MTELITTKAALDAARKAMPGTVAVVMTLGALHDGHRELMRAAARQSDRLIVTIFVNPLQFGPHEDFDRYPRTLEKDLELCRAERADVVFAPSVEEMYPGGVPSVRVDAGPLGEVYEGASRPGHFTGVLTVVCKLLQLTRAHVTFFGEKDFQQLALVRRMVRDLDIPVEVNSVPTVREPDGLARSSRNRNLSADERTAALTLSRALRAGAAQATAEGALSAAHQVIAEGTGVRLDYLALTDPLLGPPPARGPARLLVAARVGTTRLIDNFPVDLAGPADPQPGADGVIGV
jgi:pantoate--beta-alanine ligase